MKRVIPILVEDEQLRRLDEEKARSGHHRAVYIRRAIDVYMDKLDKERAKKKMGDVNAHLAGMAAEEFLPAGAMHRLAQIKEAGNE